jgi:Flp pilus assembly protein TadG
VTTARPARTDRERGAVTVEFAVALPVVAVVVAAGMAGVVVVDGQGKLQSATATAARAFGRGDDAGGRGVLERAAAGSVSVERAAGIVCVQADRAAGSGPFAGLAVHGSACAVDERSDGGAR